MVFVSECCQEGVWSVYGLLIVWMEPHVFGLLTRCCNPQTETLGALSLLEKVWELICQTAEQQPASL